MPAPEIDRYGHQILGGIGSILAREIQGRTGIESRMTALGHIQRGGSPVAFDRVLGTRFGVAAVEAAMDGAWGEMVALQTRTHRARARRGRRPSSSRWSTPTCCGSTRCSSRASPATSTPGFPPMRPERVED